MEDAAGELRLMTVTDEDLHSTVEAIRAILHDTGARPRNWLASRNQSASS
jgi:hypothetical protein